MAEENNPFAWLEEERRKVRELQQLKSAVQVIPPSQQPTVNQPQEQTKRIDWGKDGKLIQRPKITK